MNHAREDQRGSIKLSWQVDDDHLYCIETSMFCGLCLVGAILHPLICWLLAHELGAEEDTIVNLFAVLRIDFLIIDIFILIGRFSIEVIKDTRTEENQVGW